METCSNRGKEQSNMLHTAGVFIIHNSPNNVAGIVFIIILCNGKVENPGLDLILCENIDGFELPGLRANSCGRWKNWENYKLIFFCGYMFALHKKSIVFCASCGCCLTTMLYTKGAGWKTHEIYVWDNKRNLPFWNLCIKLKDCAANPHQSETINTSLNTEACKILKAERKSCCLWHFQGRKHKPSLSEQ